MKTITLTAIALLAATAGFGIYRYAVHSQGQEAEAGSFPAALPGGPQASTRAVPERLPDFTLEDLQGTPRSIRSWPDKSMIVNFWATWCAPCRREIPLLQQLQHEHGPEGFQVVGVAVDFREDVLQYAQEMGIEYPVLIGEQDGLEAVNQFGQGSLGFPFTVFTDRQQRIVLFHLGEIERAQADIMLQAVERVNRGELAPAEARLVAAKQLAALRKSAS